MVGLPRFLESPLARAFLGLLSAALLICSLPLPDIGWFAWLALAPLIIACHGLKPLKAAGLGLVSGVVSGFGIYGWLFEVPGFDMRHAIVLALYVGAYPAAWCGAMAWMSRRHLSLIVTAPVLWVAIDYLRAHAGFLALPWGTLAQSQHHNLAILQVASLGGEQAVTFLVALGNAALASLILRRERQASVTAGMILTGAHLWGAALLYSAPPQSTIAVAVIQPNIQIAERKTEEGRRITLQRLEQLTHKAISDHPSLIVWPESVIPGDLQSDSALVERLQHLTDELQIPLIVGAAQVEKFATGAADITIGRHIFNTAYLFKPAEPLGQPYRKRVLVPFAEYVPHSDILHWPEWLVPRVSEMTPGEGVQLFKVTPDLTVGTLICWENLFAVLARESARNGAQLLVQLTNDVWFGHSAAPYQHNLMSVMRAVENRVPIMIASNTGPSQIIDRYGRIVSGTPGIFVEGTAAGDIHVGAGVTWYTTTGDASVLMLFVIWCFYFVWRTCSLPAGIREAADWVSPRRT